MQKLTPHLWYDKEAKEAARFYVDAFGKNSKVRSVETLHSTPSGDVDVVAFELLGYSFMAISAGPLFKFNPSISFTVSMKTTDEVEALWNKLIVGGKALMELGEYPFSKRYGWLEDRYGLSWQIILSASGVAKQPISPVLMFAGPVCGRAEEAMHFYTSVFKDSRIHDIFRYENQPPDKDGTVAHALFTLHGQEFAAMDSAREHRFNFNEAVSLMVYCEDQSEIDYYFEKLSAVPESEQCGWLKDKYGVSWQIVPKELDEMLSAGTAEQRARVTQAFLKMKKLDIAGLKRAFEG